MLIWREIASEKKLRKYFFGPVREGEVREALSAARSSIGDFTTGIKCKKKLQEHFSACLTVSDGNRMEMIWLDAVELRGQNFTGLPCRDSIFNKRIKRDVEIEFGVRDICDWMYVDNGKLVGGETIRRVFPMLDDESLTVWEYISRFIILSKEEFDLPINVLLNNIGNGDLMAVKTLLEKK